MRLDLRWTSRIANHRDTLYVSRLDLIRNAFQADACFDAVVCTASIEYLIQPFRVFREIARLLKPAGLFVTTFSNRWFPPKAIQLWSGLHEFERPGLVLEYFLESGLLTDLETWSMRGLPRPKDDRYADRLSRSDPVHAVWGRRT